MLFGGMVGGFFDFFRGFVGLRGRVLRILLAYCRFVEARFVDFIGLLSVYGGAFCGFFTF